MTTSTGTSTGTENDTEVTVAAAAAVIRCLPAADLAPGTPIEGAAGLTAAIPAPQSKAVSATLSGAVSGAIALIVSPDLAVQIENGPIGPQELLAGLEPALADATTALAGAFGDLRYEAAQTLDAEVALANAGTAATVVVVPIAGPDGSVVASLVLLASEADAPAAAPSESAADFESLSATLPGGVASRAVELLHDVEMGVTAELGRTRMTVRELLSMQPGSIVELDRAAGSPVDLLVNGTLVARGEVVVIDEEFGVRITEIIGYDAKKPGPSA